MARFRDQVSKGIQPEPETRNQKPEDVNQKPEDGSQKTSDFSREGNTPGYSESDLELVNVAGFKVPYIVREHWKKRLQGAES